MPRLGAKYDLAVEEISRSREEYQGEDYKASGLPPAPVVMVEDEIAGQGPGISEEGVEGVIRRQLGVPELPQEPKKGILGRIFK